MTKLNKSEEIHEEHEHDHDDDVKTLSSGGQIFISGTISQQSVTEIMSAFRQAIQANEVVDIFIASGGGWAAGGFALYDMFKSVPNKVRTFGCGFVGSAANLLFVAGDERYMYKSCRMYLHDGSASIGGDFSERALKSVSNEMVVLEDLYNDYMAENSHLTAKKVKEMCRAETYLSAEDCVRMGIADYLINDFPKKLKKLKKSKKKAKK